MVSLIFVLGKGNMQSGNKGNETLFFPTKGACELLTIDNGEISQARQYIHHEVVCYVSSGKGKVWIKQNNSELVHELQVGLSVFVPKGAIVQVQSNNSVSLSMSLFTMPCAESEVLSFVEVDDSCSCWTTTSCPSSSLAQLFKPLGEFPDYVAPDNSECRLLISGTHGSLANFTLTPGITLTAVKHSVIEEIWLVQSGRGEVWLKQGDKETILTLAPGAMFTIPARTSFQLRNLQNTALTSVAITMPPWPGNHVISICEGPWIPTVQTPESVNPLHAVLADKKSRQQLGCSSALYQQPREGQQASANSQAKYKQELNLL